MNIYMAKLRSDGIYKIHILVLNNIYSLCTKYLHFNDCMRAQRT